MGLCHPLSSYLPGSAFVKYGKIDQMVMAIGLHNQYNILYIYTHPSIHIYIHIHIHTPVIRGEVLELPITTTGCFIYSFLALFLKGN